MNSEPGTCNSNLGVKANGHNHDLVLLAGMGIGFPIMSLQSSILEAQAKYQKKTHVEKSNIESLEQIFFGVTPYVTLKYSFCYKVFCMF